MPRRSFSSPSSQAETMKMEAKARALIGSEPLLSMLAFPKLYLAFRSGMIGFNYSEEGRFKRQPSKRQNSRANVTSGSSSMGPGQPLCSSEYTSQTSQTHLGVTASEDSNCRLGLELYTEPRAAIQWD